MTQKKFIRENSIEFAEYPNAEYTCKCYDGVAICTLEDSERDTSPNTLVVKYPTLEVVKKYDELAREILRYRGLSENNIQDLHYGDVMLYFGDIEYALD